MPRFPLVPLRVKLWGKSKCVILPKSLLEDMHIHEGDILALRIHGPYATFCVWPMTSLAPLGEVDVAALPPLNALKMATTTSKG